MTGTICAGRAGDARCAGRRWRRRKRGRGKGVKVLSHGVESTGTFSDRNGPKMARKEQLERDRSRRLRKFVAMFGKGKEGAEQSRSNPR